MTVPVEDEKKLLRSRVLAARAAHGDLAGASDAVCRRLARLPELAVAGTVLGYAATANEVSIDSVLRSLLAAGTAVALPWVDGDDLGAGVVADLDADVTPGWRGVREPAAGRRRAVRPSALDVLLVPGVAFDHLGNRLGYGGGHFDRLLARVRRGAVVVGVALDDQVVNTVPALEHDRPVDVIVTPTRTLRPGLARL